MTADKTFTCRVMTFNIQQLYDMGPKTWWDQSNRAQRIPPTLKQYFQTHSSCPDVLILNEAFNSYAQTIALELKDLFPYQTPVLGKSQTTGWKSTTGNFRTGFAVINGGVMILSKHAILEQRQYIYTATHTNTWDSYSNKGICYAKINVHSKHPVHILGTHLQADEGHVPFSETHRVRIQQVAEMMHYLENQLQLKHTERVMVGGDLNIEYTTDEFRTDLEETLGNKIFYEHSMPGSFSAPHNWMTKANARANRQSEQRNELLDYVLVPGEYQKTTKPAMIRVIPLKASEPWYWSYLAHQWPEENGLYSDLSDHYPVMAEFEFSA